ncbi:hypothetical protein V529_22310 [Bacillus velezensis SQR9]|nr:hypothetical protein V529_22310 [Bacillus velezensis SQR9]
MNNSLISKAFCYSKPKPNQTVNRRSKAVYKKQKKHLKQMPFSIDIATMKRVGNPRIFREVLVCA